MRLLITRAVLLVCVLSSECILGQASSPPPSPSHTQTIQPTLLKPEEVGNLLPATVFFQGKTAPVQARNSSGLRFEDKTLMLVSLVDNSGYSSQVQEKYQAYLITESPLDIDGHRLVPGTYGCGFFNNGFILMDVGGHDLFVAQATRDSDLRRPVPLQILAAPNDPGKYRLYLGRSFVRFGIGPAN
jgi:hypothetical protein